VLVGEGDGVQRRPSVPLGDQRLGRHGGLRRVQQVGGGVAVHQNLPRRQPQIEPGGLGEQRVDRLRIDGAEDECRGGPVAQQLVTEPLRHHLRVGPVGEASLGGKGPGVQPVEQALAGGADDLGLGKMDVGVDEPRQNEATRIRHGLDAGRQRLAQPPGGAHRLDHPVTTDEQAIRFVDEGGPRIGEKRIVHEVGEASPNGKRTLA
jgi:hypothetical protein